MSERTICGSINVPENHDEPAGRTLTLSYLILTGPEGRRPAAPLLILSGGPGGRTIPQDGLRGWWDEPVLKDRDLILVDQRGIGYSSPLPNMGKASFEIMRADADWEEELRLTKSMLADYRQQLEDLDIHPRYYNTFQSARDIGRLMEKLGYDRYCLGGGSYGTRLGRVLQDLYPERIRAVIHDSPNPMNDNFLFARLNNYSLALDRVLAYCAQDRACRQQHPDLRSAYLEAIESLKQEPLTLTFRGKPFTINSQDGIYLIRRNLYASDSRKTVPALIRALKDRDGAGVVDILETEYFLADFLNLTMLLSVERYEAFDSTHQPEDIAARYAEYPLIPARMGFFDAFYQAGMDWHHQQADPEKKQFRVSEVPSLILVNQYDPVTPPENGWIFKEKLPNGRLLILDEGGHGGGNKACRLRVERDFLNDPSGELDVSCLKLY